MKGFNLIVLMAVLFVPGYVFAQAPIPSCPCDTLALSDGTTGNDIVEALCPGGELAQDAVFGLSDTVVFIENGLLHYDVEIGPEVATCRISQDGDLDGVKFSAQQGELCLVSLVKRCKLNSTPYRNGA